MSNVRYRAVLSLIFMVFRRLIESMMPSMNPIIENKAAIPRLQKAPVHGAFAPRKNPRAASPKPNSMLKEERITRRCHFFSEGMRGITIASKAYSVNI